MIFSTFYLQYSLLNSYLKSRLSEGWDLEVKKAAVLSGWPSTAAEDVSWICLFLWDTVNTPWLPESQGVLPWKTGIKLQPDTVVAGGSQ